MRSVLTVFLIGALTVQAQSEPKACPDAMFAVDAGIDAMTVKVCRMATEVRAQLSSCGLDQWRALTIEIVDSVSHPLGNCVAFFDCEYDVVRITEPASWDALLAGDKAYGSLPTDITLRALLTHEITHALVAWSAPDRNIPMVDQEYIAASMELEFMDQKWRDVLLATVDLKLPPSEALIDIWIYGFSPRDFGVNAWRHFNLPENGCPLVQKIMAGDYSFAKNQRPELR